MTGRPSSLVSSAWLPRCETSTTAFDPGEARLGPTVAPTLSPPGPAPSGLGGVWPTNQWWTSVVTKPNDPLWSFPLAVRFTAEGVEFSQAGPVASANAIVTPFTPTLAVVADAAAPTVAAAGDFHVVVATGAGRLTVAQGSPATWWEPSTDTFALRADPAVTITDEQGSPLDEGASLATDHLVIATPGGTRGWDVVSSARVSWRRTGDRLEASLSGIAERPTLGVVARPADAESRWGDLAYASGLNPVTSTTVEYQLRDRDVLQRLSWKRRRGGAGLITTLPHHRLDAVELGERVGGSFANARGTLQAMLTDIVEWAAPLPTLVLDVPDVPLNDDERRVVGEELAREAETVNPAATPVGSYFGPKSLGRLATLVDVSARYGTPGETAALLDALDEAVTDWVTYDGESDQRWFGYDRVWGGMQASTSEFGAQDYNDHHFQFGYLVQAAATVVERRPERLTALRPVIDMIVDDIGVGRCRPGFPTTRVVNAYEGHSYASGFAPFADGNNQESSSEAVHAWWSITRWGVATEQLEVAQRAAALYATEAATARMYWLGEGLARPAGFRHEVSGIVWGAKTDFATFFDARPASIIGIQLLPFTFGSLYRNDPVTAQARYTAGSRDSGDHWQDLLAMDLAVADPAAASGIIDRLTTFEEGNSKAFALVWVAAQRAARS